MSDAHDADSEMLPLPNGDFVFHGIPFKVVVGPDYQARKSDVDGVVLLKRYAMAVAVSAAAGGPIQRMLEIGVWQGGSAAFWVLHRQEIEKYVGVDLARVQLELPYELVTHPRWQRVRLVGGISQSDRSALAGIVKQEFGSDRLDLIVDDASHSYEPSLASFECLFPLVRTGGTYIIEDWAWAHLPGAWQSSDHPRACDVSLSTLVLRLVLLVAATQGQVASRVLVQPGFVAVIRGPAELDSSFRLEALIPARGRALPEV